MPGVWVVGVAPGMPVRPGCPIGDCGEPGACAKRLAAAITALIRKNVPRIDVSSSLVDAGPLKKRYISGPADETSTVTFLTACAPTRPVTPILRTVLLAAVVWFVTGVPACAQSSDGLNHDRILGVIPNYQTVNNPTAATPPLTPKQKWLFFLDESRDPFNIAGEALSAGLSQADNQTPKFGEGGAAYAKRLGAAVGDFTSQNLFSDAVLACLLHQDPRYFRKGPPTRFLVRVAYSLSRIAVGRQDSGRSAFNSSGIFGMMMGIGASNLYYPSVSRTGNVMAARVGTSLGGWALGNVAAEFWPDIQRKFFQNGVLHLKRPPAASTQSKAMVQSAQ